MKKLLITFLALLLWGATYTQTRTAYVLIKEQKSTNWRCPSQQVAFKVHFFSNKMSSDTRQKALETFKERLKGRDDQARIKDYPVSMKQNDYLVFYEYKYRQSEKKDPKCTTNIRRIIKGFSISNLEGIPDKLAKKLENNWNRDDYVSHKILEIRQPFIAKEASFLDRFQKYMRENYSKKKPQKPADAIGVRG